MTETYCSAPHFSWTVESIMEKVCSCNLTLHTIFTLNIIWIFDVLSDNISLESAVFLNSMWEFHHPPLTMQGGWWWNRCSFHALGWSGYVAPIGIPISDALGLCYCAPLPSADSDGFDSFLEWSLVLAPIQPGDRGKPGLARHVSAWETQQSGSQRGRGVCSYRRPASTFNFFSYLNSIADLNVWMCIKNPSRVLNWHLLKSQSLMKMAHFQQNMIVCNATLMDRGAKSRVRSFSWQQMNQCSLHYSKSW